MRTCFLADSRLIARCSWLAIILGVLSALAAQPVSATAATGSISGTVKAGSAPLASGIVTVYTGSTGTWVADAPLANDGTYSVASLAPGDYTVQFTPYGDTGGTGYLSTYYPAAASRADAKLVNVTAGANTPAINATLTTGGAVTGTVTGPDRSGLGNIDVVGVDTISGKQFSALTQNTGAYKAVGITPSTYRVRFSDYAGIYVSEYWNDAPTASAAALVSVTAGTTQSKIDAQLAGGASISGLVTGVNGVKLSGVHVSASSVASGATVGATDTDASGAYTIANLPPGTYSIQFQPPSGSPYNGTTHATTVAVTPGQTVTGIDEQLTGGGQIAGTIVGSGGGPVSNVPVSAYPADGGSGYGYASTGADGKYKITGLTPGTYRVYFSSTSNNVGGYYPAATTYSGAQVVTVTAATTSSGIDLRAVVPVTISGHVKLPNGDAATSIPVTVGTVASNGNYFDSSSTVSTDSTGAFSIGGLAPGTYKAVFAQTGYSGSGNYRQIFWPSASTLTGGQSIVLAAGASRTDIDLTLSLGATISGKISFASGAALTYGYASLYDSTGDSALTTSSVDSAGSYTFRGLAPGTYRVSMYGYNSSSYGTRYYKDARTLATATPIVVKAGDALTGIDQALPGPGRIRGTVRTKDGAPVAGALVAAYPRYASYLSTYVTTSTTTDASGNYTLTGFPNYYSLAQNYSLRFTPPSADTTGLAPSWQGGTQYADEATSQTVADGDDYTGVDGTLLVGGQIAGTVTGTAGSAVAGVTVTVRSDYDSGANVSVGTTTDAQGKYRVKGLPDASYSVSFAPPTGYAPATRNASVPIAGGAIVEGVDQRLRAAGVITGTITTANGTGVPARVELLEETHNDTSNYGGASTYASTSNGVYRFPNVAPGRYRLRAGDDGVYLPMYYDGSTGTALAANASTFDVSAGATFTANVRVSTGASVSGTVRGPSGGVPYAAVTAYGNNGAAIRTVTTGYTGTYTLSGLRDGSYRLGYRAGGFLDRFSGNTATLAAAAKVAVSSTAPVTGQDITLASAVSPTTPGSTPTTPGSTPTTPGSTPTTPGSTPSPTPAPTSVPGSTPANGAVHGVVTTATGTPVHRATVSVQAVSGTPYYYYFSAHTDVSGSYSIPSVPAGDYIVYAYPPAGSGLSMAYSGGAADYEHASVVHVSTGPATEIPAVKLATAASISGRVIDGAGNGIPDVTVEAYDPQSGNNYSFGYTDGGGRYRIDGVGPGQLVVLFSAQSLAYVDQYFGGVNTEAKATRIAVAAGATVQNVNATLAAAGSISGSVLDSNGDLVVGPAGFYGSGPVVVATAVDGSVTKSVVVDHAGRYVVAGLTAGQYRVRFVAPGGYLSQSYNGKAIAATGDPVAVATGSTTTGINARLARGASISGTVVNRDEFGVWAKVVAYDASGVEVGETVTAEDGSYTMGVPSGAIRVAFVDPSTPSTFATAYFPGKTTLAAATAVTVDNDDLVENIDATVPGLPYYDAGGGADYPSWRSSDEIRPDFLAPPTASDAAETPPTAQSTGATVRASGNGPAASAVTGVARVAGSHVTLGSFSTVRASASGRFTVRAICAVGQTCRGSVRVLGVASRNHRSASTVLASTRAPVSWTGTRTFRLQLNATGRRLVIGHSIRATVLLDTPDAPGAAPIQRRVTVRMAPARRSSR